ncbi:MAG TPA: hypothetical protein DEO54_00775 [Rikenellaceae bacterium]|nr:MAG: hypothetical protein A2X20_00100 [Bacteroidetes bacterium GWE2_40_15]HBZ24757.1 hypothetical protein [Rikenellaceae bacterium]
MNRFLSVIFVSILLSVSCINEGADAESDIKTIDVAGAIGKGRVVQLSEIAESIEYIPLETNPNCLVAKLTWSSAIFEKEKFYIKFNHSIFVYDKKGGFLFELNRQGRGPQEYDYLSDFCVEPNGNIIIRSFEKFILYDKSGKFVKILADKKYAPGIILKKCFPLDENIYLFTTELRRGTDNEYSAIIMDLKSNKVFKIRYPDKEREFVKSLPNMYRYSFYEIIAMRSGDGILLINGLDQNIMRVDSNMNIDTLFQINLGKHSPRDIPGGIFDRGGVGSSVHRYLFPFESSGYIFAQFKLGTSAHKPRVMLRVSAKSEDDTFTSDISCSLFNKRTGEFFLVDQPEKNQIGFPDDFEGGPAVWPVYVSTCDHILAYINALDLITYSETHKVSDKFRELAGRLKETDNPVMILVKLKK